jgi:hypothetical protein
VEEGGRNLNDDDNNNDDYNNNLLQEGLVFSNQEYDAELKERSATLKELASLKIADRLSAFQNLPRNLKRIVFYPDDVSSESLPPLQEPFHWQGTLTTATQECLRMVQEELCKPSMDEDMLDEDFDPADSIYAPDDGSQGLRSFVEGLAYCYPFFAGFHVLPLIAEAGRNRICYCPCGRHMRKWQTFYSGSALEDPCTVKARKSPHELYKHIDTLAAQGCKYHQILERFLQVAFANYHQAGMRHIELENRGDQKYNEARAFVMKDIKK